MIEIDKLKSLLLTPDQLRLFEYIPRPVIRPRALQRSGVSRPQANDWAFFTQEKTFEEKVKEAFEAYKNILSEAQANRSAIDDKLVNMIDGEVKELFESLFSGIIKL